MTKISMDMRPEDGYYALTAEGHAGFRPGNDIVCAAVSAMVYALAGALENSRGLCAQLEHAEESGRFRVVCRSGAKEIAGMFFLTAVGVRQIEAKYPKNVELQ